MKLTLKPTGLHDIYSLDQHRLSNQSIVVASCYSFAFLLLGRYTWPDKMENLIKNFL